MINNLKFYLISFQLCLTLTVVAMSLSQPSPGRTKRVEISVNGSTRVAEYNGNFPQYF